MTAFNQGYALVVGVNEYHDQRLNVPTAARDAESLRNTLVDPAQSGYPPGHVELLTGRAATHEEILAALKRLANRAQPDSVVFISFTGHGALGDDNLYYLASSDVRFTGQQQIASKSGVSIVELARALRDIRSRQLLLVVNACFAGNITARAAGDVFAPEAPIGAVLPDSAGNEVLASGEGRAIITASRVDQLSHLIKDEQHSYFGQALVDGLRGGVGNGTTSGVIGLFELYEGVYRQVRGAVQQRLNLPQEPVLTLLQGIGPFAVARYPGAAGGNGQIQQHAANDLPLRLVPQNTITAIGAGATAINAETGSSVSVDNRVDNRLVTFDGATVMGGVSIGKVAQGNIVETNINYGGASASGEAAETINPLKQLPMLKARVAVARNVDEDDRGVVTLKLEQAHNALEKGDAARARQRVEEALTLLRTMNNGYINSIVRKLEALLGAI